MIIDRWLDTLCELEGSDLHLEPNNIPKYRINKKLVNLDYAPPSQREVENIVDALQVPSEFLGNLIDDKSTNFRYTTPSGNKFRVNIVESNNGKKITMRNLNRSIPDLNTLGYSDQLISYLLNIKNGLICITGSTNSGKTTSQASLIKELITTNSYNIVTLEDPIEYFHYNINSIVTQREYLTNFTDYSTAIKDAMRMDPDIILIGEMRDVDTIRAAILASETGHLVISTLHNNSVDSAYSRMITPFSSNEQNLIRAALEDSLRCIIQQELIVNKEGNGLELVYDYKIYE